MKWAFIANPDSARMRENKNVPIPVDIKWRLSEKQMTGKQSKTENRKKCTVSDMRNRNRTVRI